MELSETEVAFATSVVRKLLLASISHEDRLHPLFEKVAHADLKTLIVLGEGILTEQGWDASENPCTFKVGNTLKGPKRFV